MFYTNLNSADADAKSRWLHLNLNHNLMYYNLLSILNIVWSSAYMPNVMVFAGKYHVWSHNLMYPCTISIFVVFFSNIFTNSPILVMIKLILFYDIYQNRFQFNWFANLNAEKYFDLIYLYARNLSIFIFLISTQCLRCGGTRCALLKSGWMTTSTCFMWPSEREIL